jgi:hypothetical protein
MGKFRAQCASAPLHNSWNITVASLNHKLHVPKTVKEKLLFLAGKSTKNYNKNGPKFGTACIERVYEECPELQSEDNTTEHYTTEHSYAEPPQKKTRTDSNCKEVGVNTDKIHTADANFNTDHEVLDINQLKETDIWKLSSTATIRTAFQFGRFLIGSLY